MLDWLENSSIVLMIALLNSSSDVSLVAPIASVITVLKWWLGFLVYLPLLVCRFFDESASPG